MVYVFFGEDDGYNRTIALQNIEKNNKEKGITVVNRYDGYNHSVSEILDDLQSISLFSEKKTVIYDHAYFLSSSGKITKGTVKESSQDYEGLIDYLSLPQEEVDLYFLVGGTLDSKSKVLMQLKAINASFHHTSEMSEEDFFAFAFTHCKENNAKIDREGAKLLYLYTSYLDGFKRHGNYSLFKNELDKMMLFTDNIFGDTVKELVHQPLEDNVFDIVSSLLSKDTKKALHTYQDIRKGGLDPLQLIPIFSSQLRTFYTAKYLFEKRMSQEEIATELKMTTGRLFYMKKETQFISSNRLLFALSELGNIEKDIKLNADNADDRLLLFINDFSVKYLR